MYLFLLYKPRHSAVASASPSQKAYSRTFQSVTGVPQAISAVFQSPQDARTGAVAYQEGSCVSGFAPQTAPQRCHIGTTFLKGVFTNLPVCDTGAASFNLLVRICMATTSASGGYVSYKIRAV